MVGRLDKVFQTVKDSNKACFVAYLTAGFPDPSETVGLMMALQRGGCNVIELGVPFTDPQADGGTIQRANQVALTHKVNLSHCLTMVKEARALGLTVPVVFMGYYNPFLAYGLDALMKDCVSHGVDGFIIVDLPPEEGQAFSEKSAKFGLSYVPLVSPTTTDDRIQFLASTSSSFLYCVSLTGVTGARTELPPDLSVFVKRVRGSTNKPLAVGFGISQPSQVKQVAAFADGVVVGSAIINTIEAAMVDGMSAVDRQTKLESFTFMMTSAIEARTADVTYDAKVVDVGYTTGCKNAYFGEFGGRYIPETLVEAHRELEEAYTATLQDPTFQEEINFYRKEFIGGPTPVYLAKRITDKLGGANIWFKREELAHTGAHKINNAVGQALLAKRLGKRRIIAETGAGQHGVATACVCALMDLDCTVYMGAVDCERQKLNVFRMKMLGAKVVPVESGSRTLKDAINEAMRDWVTNVRDTHYLIGSAIGPHPFPTIVRDFQSVIGREARSQIIEKAGKLPDYVIACVGGGSNAIGMFHAFLKDKDVKIVGVEAGGEGPGGKTSATLTEGKPGVLHGTRTYLLQDQDGQIPETHSISAGLDYPGVGPEHAFLKDSGRAEYVAVTDKQAMEAFSMLCKTEGLIPALEPSHAVYYAMELAKKLPKGANVLVNLCGRGDKDMHTVAKYYGVNVN